jgi:CRP-like cAMP-binding protein
MHQEDLADLLGATSRSIITILNKWRAEGLARFDGRSAQLTITDVERFRALVHPRVAGR